MYNKKSEEEKAVPLVASFLGLLKAYVALLFSSPVQYEAWKFRPIHLFIIIIPIVIIIIIVIIILIII